MVCGANECRPWHQSCRDFYLGLGHPVDYVACTSCHLVQQQPIPSDVSGFYENYPVHTRRSPLQQWARKNLQHQVYFKPTGDVSNQVLLDYGCGDGVYLREVGDRFQSVVGYEPGAVLAASLSASSPFPVFSDEASMIREWEGRVDVITAHYVMEHVTDINGTMRTFSRLLKPGGVIHIAVPNIRSWESRLFKRAWHGLDAPRHISFPDGAIFSRFANRDDLTLTEARTATFPNTLAASLCTVLTGKYHALLFNLFILPSWLVASVASSGTEVFSLRKKI
jgi:2-polyprenyl-3-methyl-5-hydroxy-6-metoxy-1,4-benzoquinol methylase